MKKRVYLDYAASTPLDTTVLKKMMPFLKDDFGNPSSIHAEGRKAKEAIDFARKGVAAILQVSPDEIIFTGSGTESVALALWGVARMHSSAHIIISSVEHPAVTENAKFIQEQKHHVTTVEADEAGIVDPKHIASAIRMDTVLVSIMYVNNEIGSVEPIADIARVVRNERQRRKKAGEHVPLYFHTDACQAAEYLPIGVPKLGVDVLTLNASKIYGPKGIGMLYKRRDVEIAPLWKGGGQEKGFRSGTEYVAGIVGFAEALKIAEKTKQEEYTRMAHLQNYFAKKIMRAVPQAKLQGPPLGTLRVPNNINIIVPDISAETLVLYLDERGVACSSGSACASNVNRAKTKVGEGVRFTMGRHTTRADIDYTVRALCDSIRILNQCS
ncbi:MAG: cysteine desulfurase [Parcubacteria group bacterium Gr01-1014_70]|nr:MAG: cysteine desulfurase [Parcubacteria group bacterium Gr01-1014_70]